MLQVERFWDDLIEFQVRPSPKSRVPVPSPMSKAFIVRNREFQRAALDFGRVFVRIGVCIWLGILIFRRVSIDVKVFQPFGEDTKFCSSYFCSPYGGQPCFLEQEQHG